MLTLITLSQSACDSCGSDEGYTWEKKDYVLMVPFYPDSLASDSVFVNFFPDLYHTTPQIVYSSSLDSFRITMDVKGAYFGFPGSDTIWKPSYDYYWGSKELRIDYWFDYATTLKQNAQTPQCTPAMDEVFVTKVRIEAPKTVKYVTLSRY